MAKYSRIVHFLVVFAMVVNLMVESGEALSCSDISASMAQCGPYATGSVPQTSAGCCNSVKGLYGMAKTTADRGATCNCLKQSSSSFQGVQLSNINAILQKCGIPVSFTADPNFNCDSIN